MTSIYDKNIYRLLNNIFEISCPGRFLGTFLCPNLDDYSPCNCHALILGAFTIQCTTGDLEQIRQMFKTKTPTGFDNFILEPEQSMLGWNYFPEDLVGVQWVKNAIGLTGKKTNPIALCPEIHPDAFRSSKFILKRIKIQFFNLVKFNFTFLVGFSELESIFLSDNINVVISSLPAYPYLNLVHCI